MLIRNETPDDIAAMRNLLSAAFGQPDEADLVEALRAAGDAAVSLVAEVAGRVAGCMVLSRLVSPPGCLALAPVAVDPGCQGRGIGSALVRAALDRAATGGWQGVFVLGEPAYYSRFGFDAASAAPFESDYPAAYCMALALTPGGLPRQGAKVVYAGAFQAL